MIATITKVSRYVPIIVIDNLNSNKMDINFQEIEKSLTDFLMGIFAKNKPAVAAAINGYIADSKDRIMHLAEGAAKGELSYSFVVERLKEEAVNIKDYLLSVGEILAADIQEIANKAIDIFQHAINDSIGAYVADVSK